MKEVQFRIDLKSLVGLVGLVTGERSAIFPPPPESGLSPDQRSILLQEGILDQNGEIAPDYQDTLETLARAEYYLALRLTGNGDYLESMVYFSRDYRSSVAVITTNQGLWVREPAPVQEQLAVLKDYLGASSLRTLDLEVELEYQEGLALAGLTDLRRRARLRALAEDREPGEVSFSSEEVYQELLNQNNNLQWLTTLFKEMGGAGPEQGSLDTALASLAAAGLASPSGGGYTVTELTDVLANTLLVISNILIVRAGRAMPGGKVAQIGFAALQGGGNGVLLVEITGSRKFNLVILSPVMLIRHIELFLSDPVGIHTLIPDEVVNPVPPEAAAPSTVPLAGGGDCPTCGQPVLPGARFCSSCGTGLKTRVCRECGTPPGQDSKFCNQCGCPV